MQAGYLLQLKKLAVRDLFSDVPVICAGDVFDRWNAPAELINMALLHLPPLFAVPGQHDLPHHRYEDRKKSAYWTLVEAGKLTNLEPGKHIEVGRLRLHGFPWGTDVTPWEKHHDLLTEVAVVHSYIWRMHKGYEGALESLHMRRWAPRLVGYDVAAFGDNHIPFGAKLDGCRVFNCGGFMRRKLDEVDHRPRVGILHADGNVTSHFLDVSKDRFADVDHVASQLDGRSLQFISELASLTDAGINFETAIKQALETVDPETARVVLRALDDH